MVRLSGSAVGPAYPTKRDVIRRAWRAVVLCLLRSRKVAEALGFEIDGTVRSVEGEFLVMLRPPGRSAGRPGGLTRPSGSRP
jgi:hypothetical protein